MQNLQTWRRLVCRALAVAVLCPVALIANAGTGSAVPAHIAAAVLVNNTVAVKGNPVTYSTAVPLSANTVYYVYVEVTPGTFNGTPNPATVFTSNNATLQAALQGATATLSDDKTFAVYTLAPLGAVVPIDSTISFTPQGVAGNDGSIDNLAALVNGGIVNAEISIGSAVNTTSVLSDIDTAAGGNIIIFEGAGPQGGACPVALQTGYWWNPAEPGRGDFIEQQGNSIYFAAFMYATTGRATWYEASGTLAYTNSAVGPICVFNGFLYTYANGQSLGGQYVAPGAPTIVGALTIDFLDSSHATVQWPSATTNIQRYPVVAGGLSSPLTSTQPQTGFWWNPAEAGRGYTLEVQANTMYYASFMYDASGNPIWYLTGPGALMSNDSYSGILEQYCCGQVLDGPYQPTGLAIVNAGETTLQFPTPITGMMTYPDGEQVPLQRFVFVQGTAQPTLTVGLAGNGSGTVTSSPAGISCEFNCSQTFAVGTQVTLTATASAGSTFGAWSGACTGTGACVITVGANVNVDATFANASSSAVAVTVTGPGSVISTGSVIDCTQTGGIDCAGTFTAGGSVTLLANPNADGSSFQGWTGDCASAGTANTCTLSTTSAHSAGALFYPPTAM